MNLKMRCLCSFGARVRVPASGTLWMWDFPWQLLLLLAEGFPLIHCDQLKLTQLKCPSFSFWIWWVFADSLGTVDYNDEIFSILASSLCWDLFSAPFSWAGQGEVFAVQLYNSFSEISPPVQFLWHRQSGLQIPCVPWSVISILLPIPCLY